MIRVKHNSDLIKQVNELAIKEKIKVATFTGI
jgi:predicted DNA-binding protein with PD1-like motif